MSANYNGFTVVFEEPVNQEYMDAVMEALKLYKGVVAVKPFVDEAPDWMIRKQVQTEYQKMLWDALNDKKNKKV